MSTYSKEWHYEYCMGETECKHGDPECPHNHFLKDEKCECKPNKDSDNQTCQFCGVFAESEKQLAIHIEMRHQNKDSLREAVMSILGSSINFEGLADDWYIKHTEDTDKISILLTSHIEEAEEKLDRNLKNC